jgi:hypothetical protein
LDGLQVIDVADPSSPRLVTTYADFNAGSVVITGSYALEVGTLTGLLSLDAKQGSPANVSIYVKNTGTAANHDVKFLSFKPENWKVEFKPEKIDVIEEPFNSDVQQLFFNIDISVKCRFVDPDPEEFGL